MKEAIVLTVLIPSLALGQVFLPSTNLDYSMDPYLPNGQPNYRYEGFAGQTYQYDLSRGRDQLQYQTDLAAQMHDDIVRGSSLGAALDMSLGQVGGGINSNSYETSGPHIAPGLPSMGFGLR